MENFNSRMFTTILISQIIFLKDSLYVSIESWKVYNPKMLKLVIAGWWGDSDSFFFLLICALIVSFLKISWVSTKAYITENENNPKSKPFPKAQYPKSISGQMTTRWCHRVTPWAEVPRMKLTTSVELLWFYEIQNPTD